MSREESARAPTREEILTSQFYEWETRGRGWTVWSAPVDLEPPFRPFWFHHAPPGTIVDDARKPTPLSAWFERVRERITGQSGVPGANPDADEWSEDEPQPAPFESDEPIVELRVSAPAGMKVTIDGAERALLSLRACSAPVAFEVFGGADGVSVQFAAREEDAGIVREQLSSYFPDAVIQRAPASLENEWTRNGRGDAVLVDFGLANEFMLPLDASTSMDVDPLIAVVGALSELSSGEFGLLQVLFAPARSPWAESVMRAVTDGEGGPFFADAPETLPLARQKTSRPLFVAVVRVAAQSPEAGRPLAVARRLSGAFAQLSNPGANELIPLDGDGYPFDEHAEDFLRRESRRSGMILNSEELASLVHVPSASVRSPRLARETRKTRQAPALVTGHELTLGENVHAGETRPVTLSSDQRVRHMYVIGASGTGKSTFLLNCILQDIERGEGVGVLDPHGDLIDQILARVPEGRFGDVALLDPSDADRPVGFNILSAHSEVEKELLASDIVSVFRRMSTSWGDQMTSVLGNAALAMLESERGGSVADLRRFLVEPDFRQEFLESVRDSEVVYYWRKEFPLLAGKPQAPILTRLDAFLRPKPIRRMVSQRESTLDFRSIMDGRKIFLAKLAQGAIGEENAHLLGALLVSKIHQIATSRQDVAQSNRQPFYLYVDEFHNFVTASMAAALSGARKYGLGLVLAHQELRQLWNRDADVASAVVANPYTRVCFRLGDFDAQKLEEGFSSFDARDLQNLGTGEAICRVERAEYDFNLRTPPTPSVAPEAAERRTAEIRALSRQRYGQREAVAEEGAERIEEADHKRTQPVRPPARSAPSESPTPTPKNKERKSRRETVAHEEPLRGRGGPQHKYLQRLVKKMAEARGYRAAIEREILGGTGHVDVAIERGDERIACEISVSSTPEHEFANVQKCLAAGYGSVVVLSSERKALDEIREFISPRLAPETSKPVLFFLPEEFLAHLEDVDAANAGSEKTVRGYRVKVSYRAVTDDQKKAKKDAISQVVTQALRRLKSGRT